MKKKILFIIWSFSAGGGAEKILANIVNNLDENKYEIDILEYCNFNVKNEKVNSNITILKPLLKAEGNILNKIKNKIVNCLVYSKPEILRRFRIEKKYDIEVAFNYLIPESLITKDSNTLKIGWVHSSIEDLEVQDNATEKLNKIQKKLFENMDVIVPISNRTENSIIELYPEVKEKLIKIYNGYDFNMIFSKSKEKIEFKKKKNKPLIIGIGRLVEQKNFLLLIEVAKILKDKKFDFEIIILGSGEQYDKLQNKIDEYSLNEYVKLLGFIENPYPYILQSDVFCMTSKAEGFPTVLVESMALGCPFISTNVAGAEELGDNRKCGIVSGDSPLDIANELIFILENSNVREEMSKNGINKVQQYSLQNQNLNIEKLFDFNEQF